MPIGAPGWPLLACCTASIASARTALAIRADWRADFSADGLGLLWFSVVAMRGAAAGEVGGSGKHGF
jgi:hypothetical protein